MLHLVFLKLSANILILSGKFRVHIFLVFHKAFTTVLLILEINSILYITVYLYTTCQSFVEVFLEDSFKKGSINERIFLEKPDNVTTEYKSKWALGTKQHFVNIYKLVIIWLHKAAWHGKGLIDVMSRFEVKSTCRNVSSVITGGSRIVIHK